MLNRVILILSLAGMILAMHLWIQHERNFDQGCWGLGENVLRGSSFEGCRDPALEPASTIFGISTAVLGYAFYFGLATLAFAKTILSLRLAKLANDVAEIVVSVCFLYVLYLLFFQAVIAKAFCPLCLVSAAITIALFAVHVVQWKHGGFVPIQDSERIREIGYASGLIFGAMGMLVAVLLFVDQIATRRFDQGSNALQFQAMVGRSLPRFIDSKRLSEMAPARLSSSASHLKQEDWIKPDTPVVLGSSSGVSVIVFLDPNCPHCNDTYASMMRLAAQYQDKARFYILPRVLWSYSLLQVQALELAKQSSKYFDMWRLQFAHQQKGGLRLKDLESLFRELGMDTRDLEQRLSAVRTTVTSDASRAKAAGINSTPSIFIDGVAVEATSRSENSLAKLIEQASAKPNAKSTPSTEGASDVPKPE